MPCKCNQDGQCEWYDAVMSGLTTHADFPFMAARGRCLRNADPDELTRRGIDPVYDECSEYEYMPHDWEYPDGMGLPVRIRCYDNGGQTVDRYTILYQYIGDEPVLNPVWALAVGATPRHFYQHTDAVEGDHLGNPIAFDDLPESVRRAALKDTK